LKKEAEGLDKNIKELSENNNKLKTMFEKGKKLAASVLMKGCRSKMFKAFRKWHIDSKGPQVNELSKTLEEKLVQFKRLQEIHGKLEKQNEDSMVENEDLRQASMDGLEIANVWVLNNIIGCPKYGKRKRAIEFRPC
jgi:hypothetical protein